MSKTEETICVGGSATPPSASVSFNPGTKCRSWDYDCQDDYTQTAPVPYTPGPVYFLPPIPGSFGTCGSYPFGAYVDGYAAELCPNGTFYVGTFWVHVVSPQILEPDENPVTDNNFTFDATADPNGRCDVTGTGTSCVGSEETNLVWSLTAISGSTLTSNPNPPKGPNITFMYTRLPAANSYFGNKTLTLSHPAGCADTQIVQIFFTRDARNWPGNSPTGSARNWFYYWLQTIAAYSAYTPFYEPTLTAHGVTRYNTVTGQWYINMGPNTPAAGTVPVGPMVNVTLDGIDMYAFTWRHEARHAHVLNTWFPYGPNPNPNNPYPDTDNDLIPDSIEPTIPAADGGPYDPTKLDTNNNGWQDGHEYVYITQAPWVLGNADIQDWANPGHQSNR